jgi:hypothetical protein
VEALFQYTMKKIEREKRTIKRMIQIYCNAKHGGKELCDDCLSLLHYAYERLDRCPFGEEKPPCKKCKIHCYSSEKREKVKEIMKFSGPRMLIFSPFDWIKHKIKEFR